MRALILACVAIVIRAQNPAMSNTLAIPLSGPARSPAIAIDPQGRIVVAWAQETGHNPAIYLERWTGSQWEPLGGSSEGRGAGGTKGEAFNPSVAIAPSGNPAIAWQDRTYGNHEVYYRQWNGSQWEELGGSASEGGISKTNTGLSAFPSLAFDSHGAPVIAWEEHYGSKSDIWIRRYSTGLLKRGWLDLGDHPGLVGLPGKKSDARMPSLAADAKGALAVAWIDNDTGPDQVRYQRWLGSKWDSPDRSLSKGVDASITLKFDSSGQPVLCWKQAATIQVHQTNAAEPGVNPIWPALAIDAQSHPVIAYRAGSEVHFRRWSGRDWQPAGSFPWRNPPAYTLPDKRQLAMAAGAGKACAAWVEESPHVIRVGCVGL